MLKKISNFLILVERFLFGSMFFVGFISSKITAFIGLLFLAELIIHMLIDHDYGREWGKWLFS